MPQHFHEFLLKFGRNSMLQTLRFFVNLNPIHAENLRKHALDQVMAKNGSFRDLPPLRSEQNTAALLNSDQTISSQSFEGSGYRRWGHGKPMGEESGDNRAALGLGFCDGFEIVLLRNSDHHDAI